MYSRLSFALLLGFTGGCTYVNQQLSPGTINLENRAHNHTRAETFSNVETARGSTDVRDQRGPVGVDTARPSVTPGGHSQLAPAEVDRVHDGYFVGLALSGGGSRSANFAAACMFQMQRLGLLQKVDYISSVSGGSLAAAYYCLNHGDWNPANVQKKLSYSFATNILIQTLLPWDMFALVFSDYDRSDMLANALRDNLFSPAGRSQTYADLLPDRPHLLINATDLQSGRRFIFCNQSFDEINSDLSKYPIAYAVAASSSVPVVLHEVTLRDFSTRFVQYRHLVDGGLTDNLGVETLVETYRAQVDSAAQQGRADPYPNGAIFLVVDAHVEFDAQLSSRGDPGFFESLKAAAGLTSTSLLNRASTATLDDVVLRNAPDDSTARQIRDGITTLDRDGFVEFKNIGGHRVRVAHFSLAQLEGSQQLPFHGFRESINSISTYFNIASADVYELYVAAELLINDRFGSRLGGLVNEMNLSPADRQRSLPSPTLPTTQKATPASNGTLH